MPKSIDELLALVQAGDDEAAEELRTLMGSKDRAAAVAQRDLKLKTDATLKERYPRALRAFDKGKLRFTDAMTDDEVLAALKDKEDEYAELGVPVGDIPGVVAQAPAPVGEVAVATDPAQALSGVRGSSSPGGNPRDLVAEALDALKGSTVHDRAKFSGLLVEMNAAGLGDKVEMLTRALEARPISQS